MSSRSIQRCDELTGKLHGRMYRIVSTRGKLNISENEMKYRILVSSNHIINEIHTLSHSHSAACWVLLNKGRFLYKL